MKFLKSWDFFKTEDYRMWVVEKVSKYGPPIKGELPKVEEIVNMDGNEIRCDEVGVTGDSEFNWYPHYYIKENQ